MHNRLSKVNFCHRILMYKGDHMLCVVNGQHSGVGGGGTCCEELLKVICDLGVASDWGGVWGSGCGVGGLGRGRL